MSFRYALAFLTRLPGGAHPADEQGLGRAVPWFPVVGALVGSMTGATYGALHRPLGSTLAAVVAVAVGMLITGAFHEDGLADTVDGLGGFSAERRLEIMKDSRVGTFGSLALIVSTLVRVVALASFAPLDGLLALMWAHTIGRAAAVTVLASSRPARAAGLGSSSGANIGRVAAFAVAAAVAVGALAAGPATSVGLVAAAAGALGVTALARRTLGGTTGDVLGAIEQVGEMAVLVAAARLVAGQGWAWGWVWGWAGG